jgi:hypothetical protein
MTYDLVLQTPRGVLLAANEKEPLFENFLSETKLDERAKFRCAGSKHAVEAGGCKI